ncbi:MAG: putative DNA binding domain-containing protein, partial [Bacteroidales bacterium]|jgi:ATP-dependent DNA helicase RecG|nr:putative DNA binding domain-containing protein [Bacteroidales bacterium]
MNTENQIIDYKSIRKIRTGDKGFKDLAVSCIAFANAQGGTLYIGIEDKSLIPLAGQTITEDEINDTVSRLHSLCFNVSLSSSGLIKHENGGVYFKISVAPSLKSIATTSDGKIYIRIADKCEPVRNEDLQRLSIEKGAYQWELLATKFSLSDMLAENIRKFTEDIRNADRVKQHVKQMSDIEILEHYNMIDGETVTNLGVLWLGNAKQRSRISFPITVQYIVYNHLEQKVRKIEWHDNALNPKELLLEIEKEATELGYSFEFPDGLFRKQIRHYHPKVLRELLLNSFAHKSFTISSDIMICAYPDRLEISNPGGLPLGVTKDNILHQRHRRNPYFIAIMSDLGLMEGEGSGYDLIYELNGMEGKRPPVVESSFNETKVALYSDIQNVNILPLLDYTLNNYNLSQKGFIAFGAIATATKMQSTKLSAYLQLSDDERLRSYVEPLLKDGIINKKGTKKGTTYFINPKLIANSNANIKTSLKTIEPYALKALIIEDLKYHPQSLISEIAERLPDVERNELQKMLYSMVGNEIKTTGGRTYRKYELK